MKNLKIKIKNLKGCPCVKWTKAVFGFALFSIVFNTGLFAEIPTAEFLRINPSAVSSALGGSYVGYAGKIDSVYSNPAGLYSLKSQQLTATWVEYIQDVNLASFAYARPLGKNVFGVSVLYLGFSGLQVYNSSLAKMPGETAGMTNYSIGVSYARQILEDFGAGVTIKDVSQNYYDVTSNGVAVDAGASYKLSNFVFGLSALNFGPEIDGQKLPSSVRAGAVFTCPKNPLNVSIEAEKPLYTNFKAKAGAEYAIISKILVRGGYEYIKGADSMTGISGGLGFKTAWKDGFLGETARDVGISIDYAFTYFGELGNIHKISFGCNF